VSLVARALEAQGIPTLCMASALDIIAAGRPPRTVFLDYPLGHTAGKPFDRADQQRVLRATLAAFEQMGSPGQRVLLEGSWSQPAWRAEARDATSGDDRQPRDTTPRYQTPEDRRLAQASGG